MVSWGNLADRLEQWAASKYALFGGTPALTDFMTADPGWAEERLDLNDVFIGHLKPMSNWGEHDINDYWDRENGMLCPEGADVHSVYTRRAFRHGRVSFWTKWPDFSGAPSDGYCIGGLEPGTGNVWGAAWIIWDTRPATDELRVNVGGLGNTYQLEITNLVSDPTGTEHYYTVLTTESMVEFIVDGDPVAIVLGKGNLPDNKLRDNTEPYAIGTAKVDVPDTMNAFLDVTTEARDESVYLPINPAKFRAMEGVPTPPRSYPLYDDSASTLLTSGTYDAGTAYKSHPVPALGFEGKSFKFRADTTSATDGLLIEELTQEGNWRPVVTRDYSTANEYELITPTHEAAVLRLSYEPSADGASITDAEAVMR